MERQRAFCSGKGIRDLVDEYKPRADIGYGDWCWEIADGIKVLFAWPQNAWGDLKACELHSVSSEHELVWVKYYSVVSTEVKPINGLEKALVKVICPKEGVVNTFSFVTDVRDNLVEPSRVAITRDDVTLGCCFVAVLIPWSYECGEVAIIRMEGDAVVTILAVEDGLFCTTRYRVCLMQGALRVVCLTCGVKVKRLEVNCASRLAVLCTYDHALAPRDRLSYWNWFKYAE